MGFLAFTVLGVLAGALAKLILPGTHGGWISTIVLGILGANLAGWVGGLVTGEDVFSGGFFSGWSWLWAVIGAIVVTLLWARLRPGVRGR